MKKPLITKEQKDYVKKLFDAYRHDQLLDIFNDGGTWLSRDFSDFTPEQFALLLCGWYEVEEPFKVGEFVRYKDGKSFSKGYRIGEVYMVNGDKVYVKESDGFAVSSRLERLSTEEIAQEKERRKWAGIGREVGEYKDGDIAKFDDKDGLIFYGYIYNGGHYYSVMADEDHVLQTVNSDSGADAYLTLITPTEQRFDLEESK